jgi:hypothetical protein
MHGGADCCLTLRLDAMLLVWHHAAFCEVHKAAHIEKLPCLHTLPALPCSSQQLMLSSQRLPRLQPRLTCRFFHATWEFQEEVALYRDPVLRRILPKIWYANDNIDGAVRSASGYVFPPFFVLERGMTLKEWCARERGFFEVRAAARRLSHPGVCEHV